MNKADSEKINMILLQSGFAKTPDYKTADLIILNTCSVRQKGEDRVFGMLKEVRILNKERKKENKKDIIVGITGCMVRKTGMNKKYFEEKKDPSINSNDLTTSQSFKDLTPRPSPDMRGGVDSKRTPAREIEYLKDKAGIFNNDDKLFPRMPNLDFTLRIEEIKYLNLILTHIYGEKIGSDDKFDDYLKMAQLRENKFSSSVIIQTGCDNFCTFCIVPYTRGREISREHDEIIEEVKKLAKEGVKEISLVGQNVNSYGKQKNQKLWNEEKSSWNIPHPSPLPKGEGVFCSPFRKLLNDINKIEGIDRIRFTSSNPHDMTLDILDAHFDLSSSCNYLHFALQSGNDEMLKRMNRRHTYADFKRMVEYLRSKDPFFSISTDIIVGYSGETDEMFQDTLKAISELEIDFVYIARYSVRNGTIASKIYPDDVSDEIKAKRWHILNNVLEENVKKRGEKMIGHTFEVLISGEKDEMFFGRTRNFKEVFFAKKDGINIGDLVNVKILSLDNWVLIGETI